LRELEHPKSDHRRHNHASVRNSSAAVGLPPPYPWLGLGRAQETPLVVHCDSRLAQFCPGQLCALEISHPPQLSVEPPFLAGVVLGNVYRRYDCLCMLVGGSISFLRSQRRDLELRGGNWVCSGDGPSCARGSATVARQGIGGDAWAVGWLRCGRDRFNVGRRSEILGWRSLAVHRH
jgi:hypothetical protein